MHSLPAFASAIRMDGTRRTASGDLSEDRATPDIIDIGARCPAFDSIGATSKASLADLAARNRQGGQNSAQPGRKLHVRETRDPFP